MRFSFADSRFPWRSVRRCSLLLFALLLIPLAVSAQDTPSGFFPGAINVFAGNGTINGTYTDGALPTTESMGSMSAVAMDSEGDLFIAASGAVYMVYEGGTVPPILAAVTTNASTPVTPQSGYIYQVVNTVVGTSLNCSSASVAASAARYHGISAMWIDANDNLYIADSSCYDVSEIDHATATFHLLAGTPGNSSTSGNSTINGASPTSIKLSMPTGIRTDSYGNIYIADETNYAVYVIYASGATAPPPVRPAD